MWKRIPLNKDTPKAASDTNHWWQSRESMRTQSLEAEPSSLVLTNVIPSDILSQLSTEKYFRHESAIVVTLNCLLLANMLSHNPPREERAALVMRKLEERFTLWRSSELWYSHSLWEHFTTNAFGCFVSWSFWDLVSCLSSGWNGTDWSSGWPWTCSDLPESASWV